jgi:general stress protein CsbA
MNPSGLLCFLCVTSLVVGAVMLGKSDNKKKSKER